jgi:hypothetical protein
MSRRRSDDQVRVSVYPETDAPDGSITMREFAMINVLDSDRFRDNVNYVYECRRVKGVYDKFALKQIAHMRRNADAVMSIVYRDEDDSEFSGTVEALGDIFNRELEHGYDQEQENVIIERDFYVVAAGTEISEQNDVLPLQVAKSDEVLQPWAEGEDPSDAKLSVLRVHLGANIDDPPV